MAVRPGHEVRQSFRNLLAKANAVPSLISDGESEIRGLAARGIGADPGIDPALDVSTADRRNLGDYELMQEHELG